MTCPIWSRAHLGNRPRIQDSGRQTGNARPGFCGHPRHAIREVNRRSRFCFRPGVSEVNRCVARHVGPAKVLPCVPRPPPAYERRQGPASVRIVLYSPPPSRADMGQKLPLPATRRSANRQRGMFRELSIVCPRKGGREGRTDSASASRRPGRAVAG